MLTHICIFKELTHIKDWKTSWN